MEKKRTRREKTTFRRMMALLLAVLLIQASIYLIAFFAGGVLEKTESNAFYILSERTNNRKLDLENDMVSRWSNLGEGESEVLDAVGEVLARHDADVAQIGTDEALCQEIVADTASNVVDMLRRNGVTGAFLLLDCPNGEGQYPGVYIRDYDPVSFSSDNKDLLLERGLPAVARSLNITMDSYWSALFQLKKGEDRSDFFFAPMEAALREEPIDRRSEYFYHWSSRFSLSESDRPVVTYSLPLIWEDGTVIGVLGIDVTVDVLAEQLKYDELGEDKTGAYFLGISRDGGESYELVCSSGPSFRGYFGQSGSLRVKPDRYDGIVTLYGEGDGGAERTVYGALQSLKLYNVNTPFVGEQWTLIGIMSADHLLAFSHQIRGMIFLATVISLVLGCFLVFVAAHSYTRPITDLVEDLRRSDPEKPIRLKRINISEIDTLTESIENLSNAAVESASRISKIISMSHIPIGVFEYRPEMGRVFCSKSLFSVLGWPETPEEDFYLQEAEFQRRISEATRFSADEEHETERVYRVQGAGGQDRWVQFFVQEEPGRVLGAFLDVTEDMEIKRKMEYERDFDILTDLYNRRAFDEHVDRTFQKLSGGGMQTAALLMLDLDNLKYVNDTYGHDYGDRYIQAFAHCLEFFYQFRSVVGRRSGDEFNVFLYGYAGQEEIRQIVNDFWSLVGECSISLPGEDSIRVRASGGLAWYPTDATDYNELLRLADFAMYNIKHTVKGYIQEFDRKDYAQRSILIQGQDALNQMLDSRLVRYALQPVVSARDGSIYGYELLMRPMLEQLSDLKSLFLLAKAQSKLRQIEELTWFEAMDTFARLDRAGKIGRGSRAFINSIGSQCLSAASIRRLEAEYGDLLDRVVIEITENEEATSGATSHKKSVARDWSAQLALDDFGTGFNSEKVLVDVSPDIVKVDISIIHGIDHDGDRRALFQNMIRYAKARDIRVLAEGVETREELEAVIACGVDYLQGYYLGKPSFEAYSIAPEVVDDIRTLYQRYRRQNGEAE